jgi:integrase
MPVKQRENGSYQVTVCVGGRTLRKASRHWSFQDAREYERKWLSSIKDASLGRKPERTIAEALERWLTEHVPRLKSRLATEGHARQLLPYITGRKLLEAPKVWAEIKAGLAHRAPATVNHKGRILRQLCNMAANDWEWMEYSVGSRIRLLQETPRETFLTTAQVNALADACKSMAMANYVRLAAYTGIRRGHLLRLTSHDVKDGWIHLDRSSKTRTLQLVPLHSNVRAIAEGLPYPITKTDFEREWRNARKAVNIQARFHDLRHTCASWLVQNGVPLLTVKEFLGHSTIAVTQRYAHLAPQHLQDAIARVA